MRHHRTDVNLYGIVGLEKSTPSEYCGACRHGHRFFGPGNICERELVDHAANGLAVVILNNWRLCVKPGRVA